MRRSKVARTFPRVHSARVRSRSAKWKGRRTFADFNSRRLLVAFCVLTRALASTGPPPCNQVLVFKPLSIPVPRGPIGFLIDLLLSALRAVTKSTSMGPSSTRRVRQAAPRTSTILGSKVMPVPSDTQPAAAVSLGWPHLGISLRFARECISAFGLEADHSVVHLGKLMHIAFASLPGAGARPAVELYQEARTLDGHPAVGEATMFVLHAPEVAFIDLVAALSSYSRHHDLDPQRTFFWIAAFARRRLPLNERQLRITRPARSRVQTLIRWDWDTSFQLQVMQVTHHVGDFDARLRTALDEHERALSGVRAEPLPCPLHSSAFADVRHGLDPKADEHLTVPIPALIASLNDASPSAAHEGKREQSYSLLRYTSQPTTCSFQDTSFKIAL